MAQTKVDLTKARATLAAATVAAHPTEPPTTTAAQMPVPSGETKPPTLRGTQKVLSGLPSAEHSYSEHAQDTNMVVTAGGEARADAQATLETAPPTTSLTDERTLGALGDYCETLKRSLEEAKAKLGGITNATVSEIFIGYLRGVYGLYRELQNGLVLWHRSMWT